MEEHHLASYHIRKLTMTTTSLFHENFRHASRLGLITPVIIKKNIHPTKIINIFVAIQLIFLIVFSTILIKEH